MNGLVQCEQEPGKNELCHIDCQSNYVVNPVSIFSRRFSCRDGGEDIMRLTKLLKKQDACLCESFFPFCISSFFKVALL